MPDDAPTPALDEAALDERLTALEAARSWSPRAISRLEAWIRTVDDVELFRVNPLVYGASTGLEEAEAIDLFLHATKAGLFDLDWNVLCPGCGTVNSSLRTLAMVDPHISCTVCQLTAEVDLDDFIQVTFTISPAVRRIAFHDPASLSAEDLYFRYHFSRDLRPEFSGMTAAELLEANTHHVGYLAAGERVSLEFELTGFALMVRDILHAASCVYLIGANADAPRRVSVTLRDGRFTDDAQVLEPYEWDQPVGRFQYPAAGRLAPGAVSVTVANAMAERAACWIVEYPPPPGPLEPLGLNPILSAKRLLSTQTFRTLFRSETVPISESLRLRDLTFLFTDLAGSTAMYDRIGDATAYNLVRLHFDTLEEAVRENGGAIVKTIGDAVMATFAEPVGAVRAALAMLDRLEKHNRSATTPLGLRVGLHRGHAIAVDMNDQVDYFGQTVNIAARIQGLAGAGELSLTQDVLDDPAARAALGDRAMRKVRGVMKGVGDTIGVYSVGGSGAGADA